MCRGGLLEKNRKSKNVLDTEFPPLLFKQLKSSKYALEFLAHIVKLFLCELHQLIYTNTSIQPKMIQHFIVENRDKINSSRNSMGLQKIYCTFHCSVLTTIERMKTEFIGNIAFVVETGHIFVIGGQTLTGAQR